jgi:hypothetical protein
LNDDVDGRDKPGHDGYGALDLLRLLSLPRAGDRRARSIAESSAHSAFLDVAEQGQMLLDHAAHKLGDIDFRILADEFSLCWNAESPPTAHMPRLWIPAYAGMTRG